jgi:ribose transport system ATP-binding protein
MSGMSGSTLEGDAPVLAVRDVAKRFGGARALDGVSLSVLPGEIHGLLGENGSGKSTLIKILSGFHAPDAGELEVNGERVDLPLSTGQFRDLGFSFVHQDLGLVPELSVVENLFVDDVVARRGFFISWTAERRRARQVFERYALDLDPTATVESLSATERALLAIVRAVESSRRQASEQSRPCLLVLDEPTVFLPQTGKEQLYGMLRTIVADGAAAVIFVSHDLDEIRDITDRVTVFRDGRVAGTTETRNASVRDLVSLIVGRELELLARPEPTGSHAVAYRVQDVTADGIDGVSFDVGHGEVLGLTGLMGSGFSELLYMLFGARGSVTGTLQTPDGALELRSMSPVRALRAGVALVPADRQRFGCVPSLPVADNVTLPTLSRFKRTYGLSRRDMHESARQVVADYDVRPAEPKAMFESLSGGNQQKALLGKWLQTEPGLTLLHEPTQGVDVGARAQIFEMLRSAAQGGAAIVCASSDYEQLAAICDRVLIFSRGRIVAELPAAHITKERIAQHVYSSSG